jgi:hypothetical protein
LGEAELHTQTLCIGFASGQGKAEGTVILGSNDIIRADQVLVGVGTAQAKGLLEATEGDVDFRVKGLSLGMGGGYWHLEVGSIEPAVRVRDIIRYR